MTSTVRERHVSARSGVPDRQRSDDLDGDCIGVRGERFDVGSVTCQDRPAGLRNCYNERVDSRTGSGSPPQLGCSPRSRLADCRLDDAHLQESAGVGVAPWIAIERLNENHRRDQRRPQLLRLERPDERQRCLRARRETRHAAAVKDQHGSTDSVERPIPDAPSDCICGRLLPLAGLSNLSGEFFEVSVCFSECILALQLCAERDLQEFRGWEIALLQLFVEVFGQVHLHTGHTPNHTPTSSAYQRTVCAPDRSGTARLCSFRCPGMCDERSSTSMRS